MVLEAAACNEFSFLWPKAIAVRRCIYNIYNIYGMICQDISYHTVDGQNATKNFHLGSLKVCSTSYIIPHQLTKELSIKSISWWMNPSQINSMFILYLLFFYHQCQYPLISFVFVSLIWLSCDFRPSSRCRRWSMRVIQQDIMDPISSSWLLETKTSPHGSWFYGTLGGSFTRAKRGGNGEEA